MKKILFFIFLMINSSAFAEMKDAEILICEIGSAHTLNFDKLIKRTSIKDVTSEFPKKFKIKFVIDEEYEYASASVLNMDKGFLGGLMWLGVFHLDYLQYELFIKDRRGMFLLGSSNYGTNFLLTDRSIQIQYNSPSSESKIIFGICEF